jgi:hypothetical protein
MKSFKSFFEAKISPFVARTQQTAASSGTNIGMTSGDLLNTFPSSMKQVSITLPKKKKIKQQKKV